MAIPDEDVQAVRSATDLVQLVGEYTPLKRSGRRFVGLCPFHSEKSPSFSVNAEEGLYYCFGCQASGDPITFLRAIEGCSFVEAVERLAGKAGIAIRQEVSGADREAREKTKALYKAMGDAVGFYHEVLLADPEASRARQYLRSRGFDSETVRKFKLGFAPTAGNRLVKALRAPAGVLATAGLAVQGSYGPRDSFRGRVIFPIFQPDGKAVALGGRLVPGIGDGEGPKYRNSPESPIYKKRATLYALNLARQAVVHSGEVVVCEGYTDVIGFFRAGVPRAVATCGTALTEEHFKLLARFGRRIVLAFDADSAGQSAAARFYEWERRHEVEVAVCSLPPGRDPGELAEKEPATLVKAVEEARSYLQFRLERVLVSEDLRLPESRARAAEAAVAVVAEHPNELVRDQYLMEVADRTRTEVTALRPLLEKAIRRRLSETKEAASAAPNGGRRREEEPLPRDEDAPSDNYRSVRGTGGRAPGARRGPTAPQRAGRDALALAIHEPEEMAGRLEACLFTDPVQKEAFQLLVSASSLHEALSQATDDVAALLVELANSDPETGVEQGVIALVRTRGMKALKEVEAEGRQAQQQGDEATFAASREIVPWLRAELELFADVGAGESPPLAVIEAADRLVAWLRERPQEAEGSQYEHSGAGGEARSR